MKSYKLNAKQLDALRAVVVECGPVYVLRQMAFIVSNIGELTAEGDKAADEILTCSRRVEKMLEPILISE